MSSLCSYNASECSLSEQTGREERENACVECNQFPRQKLPDISLPIVRHNGRPYYGQGVVNDMVALQKKEATIDSALVTSKNSIIELVKDGELDTALTCLSVLSAIWVAHDYAYKGREITERIRQLIQEGPTTAQSEGLSVWAVFVYSQFGEKVRR